MIRINILDLSDGLRSNDNDATIPTGLPKLMAKEYQARGVPEDFDYSRLTVSYCNAARPLLERLYKAGYKVWLLEIGSAFDAEQRERYPNFDLGRRAREAGLTEGEKVEKRFDRNGRVTTIGIYSIPTSSFIKAAIYVTNLSWSALILSRRAELCSDRTLDEIWLTIKSDPDAPIRNILNLNDVSCVLCYRTDIVIMMTLGWYDDLERGMRLIFSPAILNSKDGQGMSMD